ncbi:shikimate dehydrogenase [Alisedimentitalea sp. MJ-SS2]|uniref:shikimate dehydrogenase family protein n=1 Tax=Aliisedimentitalea sp. MJ-SS2 TaxID=3049795 RepID=UPI00290A5FA3|nr:shikimate dehydrogenase [Alisedimentitalea sp. MJ-SS2]MDU8927064.1 shikimate dehydrogenase [Alisedimentitalea sp. MJ-SS2]
MSLEVLRTGLIGQNISRTRLPAALEMMCREADMALEFDLIDTAELSEFDLAACVADCRAAGWAGVSVTHPFKPNAAALFAGPAGQLGAANLLVFGEQPKAFNTDYTGFLSAWETLLHGQAPGRVAMAGAGGVARAIGRALIDLGVSDLVIWDKAPEKAQALASELGHPARAVPATVSATEITRADGIVNATNQGMTGYGGSAFPDSLPAGPKWAFDAVYTPVRTAFLVSAEKAGARVVSGFELFKHMAVQQFKILSGRDPGHGILDRLNRLMPVEEPS